MANSLLGGVLIGLASVLFLVFNGRICGISGILGGLLNFKEGDRSWRVSFVLGLATGGVALAVLDADAFRNDVIRSPLAIAAAGLLVGFGTRLGGGCTSGHGVCGIGRLSTRSIAATLLFMAAGAAVVFLIQRAFGGAV